MEPLQASNQPASIYLPDLLQKLWKQIIPILLGAIAGAALFFAFAWFFITPLYKASVTLYVNNSSSGENTRYITQSDLYASTQLVDTYAAIILSDSILENVKEETGLDMDIDTLAEMLEIEAVNDTEVFTVSVRYFLPETAAAIVDSIARIAPKQIADIVKGSSVTVINYARIPSRIDFPNYIVITLFGFGAGMCLVAGYLLLRELLNTHIQGASDFSRWEYPLIATVPDFLDKTQKSYGYSKNNRPKKGADSVSCLLSEDTPFAVQEAYKTLRTNVIFSSPDQEKKVILITSSLRGETKSTTSINLAIAFAQNQSKVLLIDCDLRLPAVAKYLGLPQSPGLTDLMMGLHTDEHIVQVLENGLHVLPSGTIPPNPTEMLGSRKMEHLLEQLSERYDYIIMDTPPLGIMPDAIILSKYASDVILVARQDMAEKTELDAVVKKLEMAKAKILGFVFTCAAEDKRRPYKKYDYRYDAVYRNNKENGSAKETESALLK